MQTKLSSIADHSFHQPPHLTKTRHQLQVIKHTKRHAVCKSNFCCSSQSVCLDAFSKYDCAVIKAINWFVSNINSRWQNLSLVYSLIAFLHLITVRVKFLEQWVHVNILTEGHISVFVFPEFCFLLHVIFSQSCQIYSCWHDPPRVLGSKPIIQMDFM